MVNFQTKNYARPLDERTLQFSKNVIRFCTKLSKNVITIELIKQVVRSGCSVGANYREANDALGKKDFLYRIRISRKEAKETMYWLNLIQEAIPNCEKDAVSLIQETQELINILSAIIEKSK